MLHCLLIRNADLYAPEHLGLRDVLIAGEQIARIDHNIDPGNIGLPVQVIDACGQKVIPGYVDQHVHIIGGGGEAGPYSRTPEVPFSEVVSAGVTTLVGVLGTDGTSRHLESLLAKARGLDYEGISAYILTGSYEIPVNNITGNCRRDIILIDKILGIGEIALSDHRSSQPTKDELKRIATQARLGGILSGKAGALQLHMGVGKAGLQMVFDILDETEIPANHFIPTHVNRCAHLFQQAKELARRGGYADLTSGIRTSDGFTGCIEPHEAIHQWWEEGLPMDKLTMSSDGNGSMSVPLPDGGARLLVTKLSSLHEEIIKAVKLGVPLEQAVRVCTSNPAQANKLWPKKGCIRTECDGDLLILNENLQIDSVIARGRVMLEHGTVLVKGTFEE